MKFDCHIHATYGKLNAADLQSGLGKAGFDGGSVFSQAPKSMAGPAGISPQERLRDVLESTRGYDHLYPFLNIDPTAPTAVDEVDEAVRQGIAGFKMTPRDFYPYDGRALPVYHRIAKHGKPLLFHSGISYGSPNSGDFNRPCNFEVLLSVPGLRFALAHVSWPWTDECIAVFGKFNAWRSRGGEGGEFFIDLTPGTPPVYRRAMLERLLLAGYDVKGNLIWGTDNHADGYRSEYNSDWAARDKGIFQEFLGDEAEEYLEALFDKNYRRFLGV